MQTPETMSLPRHTMLMALIALVFVSLALAGCGGGGNGNDSNLSSTTRQVVERTEGPFHIVASVPKRSYKKGEVIKITFSVTNLSSSRLIIASLTSSTNDGIDFGGRFGQFAVKQNDKKVFDSLPGGGTTEGGGPTLNAGATTTETYQWEQSDISALLPVKTPSLQTPINPNTAAPGTYQVIPRLNTATVTNFDGSVTTDSTLLNGGQPVTLPPLSITIEP